MEDLKTDLLHRLGPCLWRLYAEDAEAGRFMAVLSDDQGSTRCFMPLDAAAVRERLHYLTEEWARARLDDARRGPAPRRADLEWRGACGREDRRAA